MHLILSIHMTELHIKALFLTAIFSFKKIQFIQNLDGSLIRCVFMFLSATDRSQDLEELRVFLLFPSSLEVSFSHLCAYEDSSRDKSNFFLS